MIDFAPIYLFLISLLKLIIMKKLIILASALLFLANCKKEEKTEEKSNSITDALGGVKTLNNLSNSMDDITKRAEKLKKLTPLSNDELKSAIPETAMGLKRKSLSVGDNSMMKISSAEADYSDDAEKSVKISITDGAGETGSAMISMLMLGFSTNSEKTTENSSEKMGEFNGVKASVKDTKDGERITCQVQYILKERYLISIDGNGYTSDEMKSVMNNLNTSSLR